MSPEAMAELRTLRRHRRDRAERKVKAASRRLDALDERLAQARRQLESGQVEHDRERERLSAQYQGKAVTLAQLNTWSQAESALKTSLAERQTALETLRASRDTQQAQLEADRDSLRQRRIGLEKLDEMRRILDHARTHEAASS
ncbi:type III secretion system stalk subunit SctO [Salinicola avicenniae]|uniref:type III secretion system stalk subunit SctO n=1 Tax=Salinicola avicenniae TaxID=2916836 RepID=UPI002073DB43|nr:MULTISPECIES: YscO family type III secretion system apparatus protein [unclassified Salinicola]